MYAPQSSFWGIEIQIRLRLTMLPNTPHEMLPFEAAEAVNASGCDFGVLYPCCSYRLTSPACTKRCPLVALAVCHGPDGTRQLCWPLEFLTKQQVANHMLFMKLGSLSKKIGSLSNCQFFSYLVTPVWRHSALAHTLANHMLVA